MSRALVAWSVLPILLLASAFADFKAKSRMTVSGHAMDSSDFVKGARKRSEMQIAPGFRTITIYQCDLKRMVSLNEKNKTYMITELGDSDAGTASESSAPAAKSSAAPKGPGGVIMLTMNSNDTGERKQMFGQTARHVKTQMSSEASASASCGGNMKMETDGWYIDFQGQQLNCTMNPRAMGPRGNGGGECNDTVRIKHTGNARLGYPVSTTMTMSANGQPTTIKQETLELSTATLDPALFEIPPGYRQVTSYNELMGFGGGMGGAMAAARAAGSSSAPNTESSGEGSSGGSSAAGYNALASAGNSGSSRRHGGRPIRIGVVQFKNGSGASVDSSALRAELVSEIQQLNFEAVPLEVSPDANWKDLQQAAHAAGCDYYVISDVAKVKDETASAAGKKAFGGFLSHVTGTDMSSDSTKGGYGITVAYKLYAIGDKNAHLETDSSANAGTNAESSLPPVLEEEARNVGVQVLQDVETRRRDELEKQARP